METIKIKVHRRGSGERGLSQGHFYQFMWQSVKMEVIYSDIVNKLL